MTSRSTWSVAVLLTSELVTNAITHATGGAALLVVTCACGQLRVDVHDTSRLLPVAADALLDAEAGRGLMLVASPSTEWGFYRTPVGKAVLRARVRFRSWRSSGPHFAARSQSCLR